MRMAKRRGTTMVDVVTDAVYRLGRDEWWLEARNALDGLTQAAATSYQAESRGLSAATADGLDDR